MEAGRQGEGTRFRAPFDALVLILTIVFTVILVAVVASAAVAIAGHAGGALLAGLVVVGCATAACSASTDGSTSYKRGQGWTCFWGRRVSGMVTLRFPDRRVIVMPDDPERFAAEMSRINRRRPLPLLSRRPPGHGRAP
jgi:hypothetical protein